MKAKEFKTIKDLYEFFEEIPEEKWCKGNYKVGKQYCALGHLGIREAHTVKQCKVESKIEDRLWDLGIKSINLVEANDKGKTPKSGTLNYLKKFLKKKKK